MNHLARCRLYLTKIIEVQMYCCYSITEKIKMEQECLSSGNIEMDFYELGEKLGKKLGDTYEMNMVNLQHFNVHLKLNWTCQTTFRAFACFYLV